MNNKFWLVGQLVMAVLLSTTGSMVVAAGFDDPNVSAMHNMVNNLPAKAESGDPQAQTSLGMINLYGFSGKQDLPAALKWFQKAASQGYPEAMVQVGNLYENGLGVEVDPVKAFGWYKQASDLNYPQGRFRLGLLIYDGIGTNKSEDEGVKLFRSACDNGYRTSCGMLYWRENKIVEARSEFKMQCQDGDQLACNYLKQVGDDSVGNQEPGQKQGGRVWIYLLIGLVLVGLLAFWLLRKEPGEEAGKSE